MVQVIRTGVETWSVYRVSSGGGVHEYEVVGRVLRDGDLYYFDTVEWMTEGYVWRRNPRGYQIPRGALRALIKPAAEPGKVTH